jgi:hypothetical protein
MKPKPKPEPARLGRPYKLTPALKARVLELAKEGHFLQTICAACRISRQSLHTYRKTDTAFSDDLDAAMASGEMALGNVVMKKAVQGDTENARWLLVHRHQHWHPKVKVEVSQQLDSFAATLRDRLPHDAMALVDVVVEEYMSGQGSVEDEIFPPIGPSPSPSKARS